MERILISLDTKGSAIPGVDRSFLDKEISAETKTYSNAISGTYSKKYLPPPEGSQGEGAIEWVIDQLLDPDKAKFYAKIFLHSINRILIANTKKRVKSKKEEKNGEEEKKNNLLVEINAFNKTLFLPALSIVIKEFLESLGDD